MPGTGPGPDSESEAGQVAGCDGYYASGPGGRGCHSHGHESVDATNDDD